MIPFLTSFEISFIYQKSLYNAMVYRYNLIPVKYLFLLDRRNCIDNVLPPTLLATVADGLLDFNDDGQQFHLISAIEKALVDYCAAKEIPLY